MHTGVEPQSKTRRRLTTIAAATGSTVIIALAIAFVAVDFNDFYVSPSFQVDSSAIEALEPIRSDPESEPGNTGDGSDDGSDDGNGNGGFVDLSNDKDNDIDDDSDPNNYPEHGLPCLDPNCPIHHGNDNDTSHTIPCDDPNCPICNHDSPCGDPDCPICNGHGLPCDDPDCPIHHGKDGNNNDFDKPPADISLETVRFKANSSEYVDKTAAEKILSDYIDSINRYFELYPDDKIYLVGCIAKTARWSLTETELSEQRANTVRQSLIDLGIDGDKLVAIGIGINDPWRNDEWEKGYFDEETAKLNRRVWLIPDQYDEQVGMILAVDELIDSLKASE